MLGRLAAPVWVDDEDFDLTYHVRRSALPRPGGPEQLRELVGRLIGRRLDRHRPLWEIYLVEGLEHGRIGLVTKTHHAMVDGVSAVDLGTVLLDETPEPRPSPVDPWAPRRGPGSLALLADAVGSYAAQPTRIVGAARDAVVDGRSTLTRAAGAAGGAVASLRTVSRPAPSSPLNVAPGAQRRFSSVRTDLDDYRRVRAAHGGTVNDVVLATVTGALRAWLLTRGEPVTPASTLRALVPVSVRDSAGRGQLGNRVSPVVVDLPVGEGNPVMRLHQVSFAMRDHQESGSAVGAEALVALSGFAPPTLHSLGARVAAGLGRRPFNLVVTNVPGPQFPLYAAGARLLEVYPVVPLSAGQALTVGLTSYDGGVFYGLNADRDAMSDVDVLAGCLQESLAELVGTERR